MTPASPSCWTSIGIALAKQGKLAEALTHQRRALVVWEEALGPRHPYIANTLNNMSVVLRMQGSLDEALILQRRVLSVWEEAWGEEHPNVASSLDNIGSVLAAQGSLDEALVSYRRGLTIREEALGERHPDVAGSLNNIANVVSDQGKLGEALFLYRRALTIEEEALGEQHPDIAGTLNNIGIVLMGQGALDEALVHQRRALAIFERSLGEHHPDLGSLLNTMGTVLVGQGQLDEALLLHRRALTIWEETLGPRHTRVAGSLNNIGSALRLQGKLSESRNHHQRALAIWEEALGDQHPELANALVGLAMAALDQRILTPHACMPSAPSRFARPANTHRSVSLRPASCSPGQRGPNACSAPGRARWLNRLAIAMRSTARATRTISPKSSSGCPSTACGEPSPWGRLASISVVVAIVVIEVRIVTYWSMNLLRPTLSAFDERESTMKLIHPLPLLLLSLGLVVPACDSDPSPLDAAQSEQETEFRVIDHVAIAELDADEDIVIDIRGTDLVWVLDFDSGPIDLSRITVICANGQAMPLSDWFGILGRIPAEDTGGQFAIANDPADFGTLDSSRSNECGI